MAKWLKSPADGMIVVIRRAMYFHKKYVSLEECIAAAVERGYTQKFIAGLRGITLQNRTYTYSPEETDVRFSYAIDNRTCGSKSIFYVIETCDGKKGYVADTHETGSQNPSPDFIKKIDRISRLKMPRGHAYTTESWISSVREVLGLWDDSI